MKPNRIIAVAILLVLLMPACSKKKTGTVISLILEQTGNEMLAHVKLDDGTEAIAFPKIFSRIEGGTKWELAKAGQRVEVEPASADEMKNSKAKWKIVRVLEAGK